MNASQFSDERRRLFEAGKDGNALGDLPQGRNQPCDLFQSEDEYDVDPPEALRPGMQLRSKVSKLRVNAGR
jgi:hypothetical protein